MDARPGSTAALVTALTGWSDRLWPDVDRGRAAAAALRERFGDDDRDVDAAVGREVEELLHAWSRHVALDVDPAGTARPDVDPPGWGEPDAAAVHARAGSVTAVTRRPDGIATIRLDGLDALHLARPYLDAALAHARTARGVVLDLRGNGGGDPATVAHVVDWVVGPEPTHVSDVRYRDRLRQWWTAGRPAAEALPPGTPLAVLVGAGTFSSGEALAFHLQQRCGAVVVGRTTRGAADHITPVQVTAQVRAYLPEAFVVDAASGTSWEGVGVRPDVDVPEEDAVERAAERLLAAPSGRGVGGP